MMKSGTLYTVARAHASTRVFFSCSKQKGLRPFESLCEKSFTKESGAPPPAPQTPRKLYYEKLQMCGNGNSSLTEKGLRPFESLCERSFTKESGAPPPAPLDSRGDEEKS